MAVDYRKNLGGYRVLTPSGYKQFAGIPCIGKRPIYRLEFENNYWVECTSNHKIFINGKERVAVEQLKLGDIVLSNAGPIRLLSKIDLNREELVYDLVEVDGGHQYYTNGVLSSNCEFIINDETLINAVRLVELEGKEPIEKQAQVRWYKKPSPDNVYCIALDPSLGTGGDPAAIQVFELPSLEQVAEWQHNKTPVQQQVRILREIVNAVAETIGSNTDVYYSLENNTLGEAALVCVSDLGEETFRGVFLSEPMRAGNVRRFRKGFNTTNKSKLAACSKLKNLIETRRLTIYSKNLISELKTYVAHGTSFAAKTGETDDLVSATLLVVRMLQLVQSFDARIDQKLQSDSEEFVEPMPFILIR